MRRKQTTPYTAQFQAQVIGQALAERATLPPLSHNWHYMRLIARQLQQEKESKQ